MPPKATNDSAQATPVPTISGKWLIISVFSIALLGAITSWWFRYSTTHRSAGFWGPQVAQMIRDAPLVEFRKIDPPLKGSLPARDSGQLEQHVSGHDLINITAAPGLVHLRNALVEDRSFVWPAALPNPEDRWAWVMIFREDSTRAGATLLFTQEGDRIASLEAPEAVVSSEPVAKGLREMFAEFSAMPQEAVPANEAPSPAADAAPADSQR